MSGKPKTVFRRPTQNNYFSSKREWMQDSRLSLRATGLIAKMLSMPPQWEFHQSHLVTLIPEGKDYLRSAFKEAAKYGYLIKYPRIRDEKGQYNTQVYEIWDSPQFSTPIPDELIESLFSHNPDWNELKKYLPESVLPKSENPTSVNPPLEQSNTLPTEEKEEQQQKNKNNAVVFPESLKNLDIPEKEKKWLVENRTTQQIEHAISFTFHPQTKINKGVVQTLKWASKALPEIPKEEIDLSKENLKFAESFRSCTSNTSKYEILSRGVEIFNDRGGMGLVVLEYTKKDFKERLVESLKKFKFNIEK